MLKVVPVSAAWFCFPWGIRLRLEPEHGGRCCYCNRDVAVPDRLRNMHVACIYCGLERGELPLTEAEDYAPDVPILSSMVLMKL